jgi:S1-C subfamily serine protease
MAPVPAPAQTSSGSVLERELTAVVERVNPSVVFVRAFRRVPGCGGEQGICEGTGVILEGGLIATTLSVAGPGDSVTVRYSDSRMSRARVAAVDPLRELTILRPERPGGRPLETGPSGVLHAGSWVFVVGFSLSSIEPSLTSGRFSSRTILGLSESTPDTVELLQLEANVYPGNSGAAVIDSRGRLVGVLLAGLGRDGALDPVVLSSFHDDLSIRIMTAEPPLGISFALPSEEVLDIVQAAGTGDAGTHGYLGVRVEVPAERVLPGEFGVRIQDVVAGSPADRAGLERGDYILRLQDVPVRNPMMLASLIRATPPGERARIELMSSDGKPRQTEVMIGDYTADYRMGLVWRRLLSGRSAGLEQAWRRLSKQLQSLERERQRLQTLETTASSVARRGR